MPTVTVTTGRTNLGTAQGLDGALVHISSIQQHRTLARSSQGPRAETVMGALTRMGILIQTEMSTGPSPTVRMHSHWKIPNGETAISTAGVTIKAKEQN